MDEKELILARIYLLMLTVATLPLAFLYSLGWGIVWCGAVGMIGFVVYLDKKGYK